MNPRGRSARGTGAAGERDVLNGLQAADFLGVDKGTLYLEAAKGNIPHRKLGRRYLFSRAALLEWLAARPG
jgi:excisionase family DNA binding protein